jgi:hypothetical protein
MMHVFVETNWVFAVAAPAHHKRPDAMELLERARRNELQLHLPSPCLIEARQPILTKCQPRNEADAIRQFLLWSKLSGTISAEQDAITRGVLDRFEQQVRAELRQLDETIRGLRTRAGVNLYALNERMLSKTIELAEMNLGLKPFDQAILGAVLIRAEELREKGEADLCFCEMDADLQPWDKNGNAKQPLTDLYDRSNVWVYGDFSLTLPERPEDWPIAADQSK